MVTRRSQSQCSRGKPPGYFEIDWKEHKRDQSFHGTSGAVVREIFLDAQADVSKECWIEIKTYELESQFLTEFIV